MNHASKCRGDLLYIKEAESVARLPHFRCSVCLKIFVIIGNRIEECLKPDDHASAMVAFEREQLRARLSKEDLVTWRPSGSLRGQRKVYCRSKNAIYVRRYYRKHRKELLAKKLDRYHSDEAHRERILARQSMARKEKKPQN